MSIDRPGLIAAGALLATLAISALWAGVDLYSARTRPERRLLR